MNSSSEYGPFNPALNDEFTVAQEDIILVLPDSAEKEKYQLLISHLNQLLAQDDATAEQRAQILYQLGILYDRLGLEASARNMFMSALIQVPDYARAYNFLGIYLVSAERFNEAYEAYDSVLEIEPDDEYARFNRGIALYYGNRARLGIKDLEFFYEKDKNDPFRIAWLYILEREVEGQEAAQVKLKQRRDAVTEEVPWGLEVLDFLLGKINSHQLIDAVRQADIDNSERARRLCEAYFYMGKKAAFEGEIKYSYDLYHLCVNTNVAGYLEYRYAQLEISRYLRQELIYRDDQRALKQQMARDAFLKKQAAEAQKYFEEINLKDLSSQSKSDDKVKGKDDKKGETKNSRKKEGTRSEDSSDQKTPLSKPVQPFDRQNPEQFSDPASGSNVSLEK